MSLSRAEAAIAAKIEAETRIAILRAALTIAAEQPAAFELLEKGLQAIREVFQEAKR
jgi:hypothetical protein